MKANCPKSCGLCDGEWLVTFELSLASACIIYILVFSVWLQWSGWSLCNATCNGGVQSRNRTCAIDKCVGETTEMTTCNTFQCNSKFKENIVWKKCGNGSCNRPNPSKYTCLGNSYVPKLLYLYLACVDQTSSCSLLEKVGKCREVLWKYMCKNTCGLCAEPPMTGRRYTTHLLTVIFVGCEWVGW